MGTRQYMGARYVPKFANPIEWNRTLSYEGLTIVTHLGNSFTSKKSVPAGVDISNTEYWANTGNYNAQVEEYRQATENYAKAVEGVKNSIGELNDGRYFGYLFCPYCSEPVYFPQGACNLGNGIVVVAYANTGNDQTIFQKININTGAIILETTVQAYHANTLSYDGNNTIYSSNFYVSGTTGNSNVVSLIDANTLELIGTITIPNVNGVRSALYRYGYLYIQDRGTPATFWKYEIATGVVTKMFTFDITTMQNCYLDSNMNLWVIDGIGTLIYKYNLDGERISTISMRPLSDDLSVVNVELENIFELDDGTICLTDVGWKLTANGRYNRHIFSTLGKQKQNKHATNTTLTFDSTDGVIQVSNTYNTFQNGTVGAKYDSLDYAGKVGIYLPNNIIINCNGETIEQFCVLSNGFISIYNGTISGVAMENGILVLDTLTVNNACVSAMAKHLGSNMLAMVIGKRGCQLRINATIDGGGIEGVIGVYYAYASDATILAGKIINCATPVLTNAGQMSYYGGYIPDTTHAPSRTPYMCEQDANVNYRVVGLDYGMKTVTVGDTLNNVSTITFNARGLEIGSKLALVLDTYYTFECIIGLSNAIPISYIKGGEFISGVIGITYQTVDDKLVVTLATKQLYRLTGGAFEAIDGSAITLTKARIY